MWEGKSWLIGSIMKMHEKESDWELGKDSFKYPSATNSIHYKPIHITNFAFAWLLPSCHLSSCPVIENLFWPWSIPGLPHMSLEEIWLLCDFVPIFWTLLDFGSDSALEIATQETCSTCKVSFSSPLGLKLYINFDL